MKIITTLFNVEIYCTFYQEIGKWVWSSNIFFIVFPLEWSPDYSLVILWLVIRPVYIESFVWLIMMIYFCRTLMVRPFSCWHCLLYRSSWISSWAPPSSFVTRSSESSWPSLRSTPNKLSYTRTLILALDIDSPSPWVRTLCSCVHTNTMWTT